MKMLEKLDQVDWDSLSGTYGSAVGVPQLIRELLSEDETEWEHAYYDLDSLIWHQGTVYEATAFVIPFLVELLEYEFVINRDWILMGLVPLANGHSYFDVHYHLDPVWADKYLAEQGTNIENQLQKELSYVKNARAAVLEHSDIYLRLLDHEKSELVVASVTLLSELVELSEDLFPRFKQLYVEDSRLRVRNSVLHGIRKLNISPQAKSDFFEPIFDQEEDLLLKSAAALGAFEAQQSNYRSDIFDYLFDFCRFLEQETEYGHLDSDPWGGPSINIRQVIEACLLISSTTNIEEIKRVALGMEKNR
jgi:hypothetical protein